MRQETGSDFWCGRKGQQHETGPWPRQLQNCTPHHGHHKDDGCSWCDWLTTLHLVTSLSVLSLLAGNGRRRWAVGRVPASAVCILVCLYNTPLCDYPDILFWHGAHLHNCNCKS